MFSTLAALIHENASADCFDPSLQQGTDLDTNRLIVSAENWESALR